MSAQKPAEHDELSETLTYMALGIKCTIRERFNDD